ncbi:MAG: ABC transporter permease [Bacteroidetes bacterium]|nr:ABC transporter permease [Bacteroidota bacterium]
MKNSRSNSVFSAFSREIDRILHDSVYLFTGVIAPVISFTLIALIFSANVPRKLPVAIVDQDHTALSRKIIRTIGASPIVLPDTRYSAPEEARKALVSGEMDAVVVIPAGTGLKIMRGQHAGVAVYLNNVYLIKAGLLKSGIQKSIAALTAGIKLQNHMMWGESPSMAMAKIQAVQLTPVLLFNPYTSYEYYLTLLLLPVMLTVFVLFGTIYALGTELQYGTGPGWLDSAGGRMPQALIGKLIPHTAAYIGLAMIMNIIFFEVLGLPLNGHILLILVSELVMILSYQSMAIFIVALTRNLRLALSLASAYTMLAITFAGLTFPAFGMPAVAQIFSKIFPFTYWLELFAGQTLRGEPTSNAIVNIWFMVIFIVAGLCLVPRLKYLLKHEQSWGKI